MLILSGGTMSRSHQPTQEPSPGQSPYESPPPEPALISPPSMMRTKRRGRKPLLVVGLLMLAILIVVGGLIGQHLLSTGTSSASPTAVPNFQAHGPFVGPPLSAQQINELMHLKDHMKYRALASLYVAHMNLNDEIGQLIMLEYNQPFYSADLDYAVNTLHVGGVIMYA